MNIKALRDERAVKAAEARNLLDTNTGDKWSAAIRDQVDAIYKVIDGIDEQIARAERQAELDAEQLDDGQRIENRERDRAGMSAAQRETADRYDAAFRNFILNGDRGCSVEEVQLLAAAVRADQTTGNGAGGGYLVPTGWGGRLLEALKAFGGMREAATIISTNGGNTIPWPTVDETGQEGEIVAENQPASDDDLEFGAVDIGAYKYSSKVFCIPIELLQDQGPGMDIEGFIRRAAATRIFRVTNRHFTTGTGVNQPRGIATASGAGVIGAAGTALTVGYDQLVDLEHSVDPEYRILPGVGFMFHDRTLRQLKKLKDGDQRPLWLPGVSTKEPDTILGYGYRINQAMPEMAANAKSILFGDLKSYLIRDVMNVTLRRFDDSPYAKKGQVGFLAWSRHDGDLVTAGAPVKAYQNGAN